MQVTRLNYMAAIFTANYSSYVIKQLNEHVLLFPVVCLTVLNVTLSMCVEPHPGGGGDKVLCVLWVAIHIYALSIILNLSLICVLHVELSVR